MDSRLRGNDKVGGGMTNDEKREEDKQELKVGD